MARDADAQRWYFVRILWRNSAKNEISDILLIGTGALLNATTVLQKESIPGVSHLVRITKEV